MKSTQTSIAVNTTRTSCPYCGVGCGVVATESTSGNIEISGDATHPANKGHLCSKGLDLANVLNNEGRLLSPEVNGAPVDWSTALDQIAGAFKKIIAKHGTEAIAFYVSGQLLTEDYYVVNKLTKGYLGHANIDTNSRLCMASSVAGHRRAFGSDTVPGCYEDFDEADLIILCGSNLAWCHPVLFQRIATAKKSKPSLRVVVVDPRRTATCELSDIHLAINPDTDSTLFNGLLNYLSEHDELNQHYINSHTQDLGLALQTSASTSIQSAAQHTSLSIEDISEFYRLYARTEKVVTVYSQGVNQSQTGTDTVNSIINCHLATGRIGRPGMGPFSVTGQPNAMGGREVGGLANMLAAHMDIDNKTHQQLVKRFWASPTIADKQGLKAVELFDAVNDGQIKAIWIMATNPIDSMPEANFVKAALKKCPLVIVSDVVANTDTSDMAHVRLPACAWGEKDGTVTNSERTITRQRAFHPAAGESKPDWWAVCQIAKRLGFSKAFNFKNSASIFREHAALSGYSNNGSRDFDISAYGNITDDEYQTLSPFQWPCRPGEKNKTTRFFANGGFYTGNGLGRFIPIMPLRCDKPQDPDALVLNTGRIRDQWHTMTRTGNSARLSAHMAEPYAELHPIDAKKNNIGDADLVSVTGKQGSIIVRALITSNQKRGSLFIPMHWTDQRSANSRVNSLITAITDPYSGQPASKSEPVTVKRYAAGHYGFAVINNRKLLDPLLNYLSVENYANPYWALSPCSNGWRIEFASMELPQVAFNQWQHFLYRADKEDTQLVSSQDNHALRHHLAVFKDETLITAVYLSNDPVRVSRHWATSQIGKPFNNSDRHRVLAARPANDQPDVGAIICSCFMVGKNEIETAVYEKQCNTVEKIGCALKAGTNCGSCRGEINGIIQQQNVRAKEEVF